MINLGRGNAKSITFAMAIRRALYRNNIEEIVFTFSRYLTDFDALHSDTVALCKAIRSENMSFKQDIRELKGE